ncbi:MAG: DegT/DnrJ/EryC1/StrS family aminotransferase [Candidatus Pacebacteria bacterium]|nr:DegT/DnrJ/EryC1/StrS family aminotransferase [Candidatus Paceibacterota bacterium]
MKFKVPFVNYQLQYQNSKKEMDNVIQGVLSRGDLILRQDVEEFEKNLALVAGTKYAVGLNSGTDALILSLRAAGIGPGDEVITVSHTFLASIAAIVHVGAKPILIEVKEDFTIDVDKIEEVLTEKTKAIMPVHLNGRVCQMDKLMDIAKKHNLIVVEDAAQALEAKFKGKRAGSFGKAGCFSFYPAKILGAYGDAGGVTTDDKEIAEKIRLFRDHGQKTPAPEQARYGVKKTEVVCYGWTARLDNLQAAVLNAKFKYLPEWIKRRREIAAIYDKGLRDVSGIELPPAPAFAEDSAGRSDFDDKHFDVFQNYVLKAQKRDELFNFLKKKGVETLIKDPIANHHHLNLGLSSFKLPYTEKLAKEVISLPLYPELTQEQIEYVIECVKNFYAR